jgi:hypothetical protein
VNPPSAFSPAPKFRKNADRPILEQRSGASGLLSMEPDPLIDDASAEAQVPYDSARLSVEITRAIQAIREGIDSGAYESDGNLLAQSQS